MPSGVRGGGGWGRRGGGSNVWSDRYLIRRPDIDPISDRYNILSVILRLCQRVLFSHGQIFRL